MLSWRNSYHHLERIILLETSAKDKQMWRPKFITNSCSYLSCCWLFTLNVRVCSAYIGNRSCWRLFSSEDTCHLLIYFNTGELCVDSAHLLQASFCTFNDVAILQSRGQHDAMELRLDKDREKLLLEFHLFMKEWFLCSLFSIFLCARQFKWEMIHCSKKLRQEVHMGASRVTSFEQ